jgi:hypothetical protein
MAALKASLNRKASSKTARRRHVTPARKAKRKASASSRA